MIVSGIWREMGQISYLPHVSPKCHMAVTAGLICVRCLLDAFVFRQTSFHDPVDLFGAAELDKNRTGWI